MTKFKDIIFEPNIAIHCPEEWMADNLLEYADSIGYKWRNGKSYLLENNWQVRKENTCYNLNKGVYDFKQFYNKDNKYKVLHYNDVVIREDKMEASLEYKLMIKGREAKIGSELWFNDGDGISKVTIDKISIFKFQSPQVRLKNEKNKYTFFRIDDLGFIECFLYWEKPIIYQLPDTEGNLSEVKIGQHVWVSSDDGRFWEADIIENKDTPTQCKINGDYIVVKYHTGHRTHFNNITGVNHNGRLKITTNKPKRDFSPYFDFNQAPNGFDFGMVYSSGYAYWCLNKPSIGIAEWHNGKTIISAGFRQNLINPATGFVDDWKDSLVMRPKDVYREVRDES